MATMLNPNAIPDGSITSAKLDKAYAIEENLPPLFKGTGENSVQMNNCTASGANSFAEGDYTFAVGNNSHAEGNDTYANNPNSHAEGGNTFANGDSSHAEGCGNTASGRFSHVEGSSNQSIGESSHAEGCETEASGDHSHSEGRSTIAKGEDSHAEGCASQAKKACSHAEGTGTIADGDSSHSEGFYTKASNDAEHAEGKYNLSTLGKTIHSVGIGEADDTRMNAFEIFNDGSVLVKGVGGYDGTNGTSAKTIQTVIGEKQDKTAFDSHNNDNTRHITAAERTKWNAKQDKISDLDTIRSGAAKGATALQSIPAEYVTETELEGLGFATTTQVDKKQDIIADLADIRSGAAKGATALQSYTEKYTGTITGITMNGASKGTSGVVNLGTVITEHQDISGKADKSSLAVVATSGSYNDLSNKPTIPSEQVNADWNATSGKAQILNKPTIPSAVTESIVSGWGFTKNTGTYSKPSTGIPRSDLESAVQTSLGKADTALQSYTEQYKGTVTGVKINSTTKNPSNGVVDLGTVITSHQDISGKQDKLVSGTNIKTINGKSILGSGDITISGGGSGGAYPEVNHGTSDTTFTLTPNTFHVWDEVTSLILTFGSETSGVANEYLFQFTSGSTATSLTLPNDIKWANDNAPTIGVNMIYQISILRGLASVLEFNNAIVFPTIGDTGGKPNEEYAKVYEYFVNTYNLTQTSASPSNGVAITETLVCNDATYGGPVLKVSLHQMGLLLWTQKASSMLYVPSIDSSGEYSLYFWD